jgi:hypothetical protein
MSGLGGKRGRLRRGVAEIVLRDACREFRPEGSYSTIHDSHFLIAHITASPQLFIILQSGIARFQLETLQTSECWYIVETQVVCDVARGGWPVVLVVFFP